VSSSLLADIVLLSALAVAAAAFRSFVRVPLRIPSHSVLQWLPVIILGQLWVHRSWAGLYQGSLIGAICCLHPGRIMLSFGALAPLSEYVLAGGLVSWVLHLLGSPTSFGWRVWLICPAVGLMANLGRWVYRLAYYLPFLQGALPHYGLAGYILFYAFFGVGAGLIAAAAYTAFQKKAKKNLTGPLAIPYNRFFT